MQTRLTIGVNTVICVCGKFVPKIKAHLDRKENDNIEKKFVRVRKLIMTFLKKADDFEEINSKGS